MLVGWGCLLWISIFAYIIILPRRTFGPRNQAPPRRRKSEAVLRRYMNAVKMRYSDGRCVMVVGLTHTHDYESHARPP